MPSIYVLVARKRSTSEEIDLKALEAQIPPIGELVDEEAAVTA